MMAPEELRLLPWSGPDEKPFFLSTDSTDSHLSRLADAIEAEHLAVAADLVDYAAETLTHEDADVDRLRRLAAALLESLSRALSVANGRGHRLPYPAPIAGGLDD